MDHSETMDSDDVIQSCRDDVIETITSQQSLSGENSLVPDGSKSITDRSVNRITVSQSIILGWMAKTLFGEADLNKHL